MSTSDNRRNSPRYPANISIRFRKTQDSEAQDWSEGRIITAGTRGLFIQTDTEFNLKDLIEIELPLQGGAKIITGTVAWLGTSEPVGIGIFLSEINEDTSNLIMEEIESGRWLTDGASQSEKSDSSIFIADLSQFLKDTE